MLGELDLINLAGLVMMEPELASSESVLIACDTLSDCASSRACSAGSIEFEQARALMRLFLLAENWDEERS